MIVLSAKDIPQINLLILKKKVPKPMTVSLLSKQINQLGKNNEKHKRCNKGN